MVDSARLYKLVLYKKGGHFVAHRDTANTICPLCKDILAAHAALLEHVHDYHVEHAAQTGGSTPEKATSEFTASSAVPRGVGFSQHPGN